MAKLKYIKELLSFIGALVLACIGWAFSYKTLLLPLTAFLIVLVIAIIIWLVSNVVCLLKATKALKEAVKGQVSYRNKIKSERDQYKQKLKSANKTNELLVSVISKDSSAIQKAFKSAFEDVFRKIVEEEDKHVKKAIQNSKDN